MEIVNLENGPMNHLIDIRLAEEVWPISSANLHHTFEVSLKTQPTW
jgi:hypothetical protein